MTEKAGLADTRWSLNAAWLDYDRDGDLDLFVANYLEYDEGRFRSYYAAAGYPGPLSYNGVSCTLYRNNGDATFSDVTKAAGVANAGGRAMSVVAADLDNDGWMDLYVANDSMENYYYENRHDGTFTEKALELGARARPERAGRLVDGSFGRRPRRRRESRHPDPGHGLREPAREAGRVLRTTSSVPPGWQ